MSQSRSIWVSTGFFYRASHLCNYGWPTGANRMLAGLAGVQWRGLNQPQGAGSGLGPLIRRKNRG